MQIMRVKLTPGEHDLLLTYGGSGVNTPIKIIMKEHEKKVLRVLSTGSQLRLFNLIDKL